MATKTGATAESVNINISVDHVKAPGSISKKRYMPSEFKFLI